MPRDVSELHGRDATSSSPANHGLTYLGNAWGFKKNNKKLQISFLGWLHPDMFFSSHLRHHRYTQNEPYDQEAPMPVLPTVKDFLGFAFVNVKGFVEIFDQTWRAAFGRYPTGHLGWRAVWEDVCYPPSKPEARSPAQLWCDRYLPPCPLLRS